MKEMKKKKNKNNKNNKKIIGSIFILILLTLTIGYAYLTKVLKINTTATIAKTTWDIHFENIIIKEGSIEGITPTINSDKTTVSLVVNLKKPGEYYTYYVDVVNKGTIDAKVENIIKTTLTEKQQKYIDYKVTYDDDIEIKKNELLRAGEKETIKVTIKFKNVTESSNLPTETETIEFENRIDYIQDDGKGIKREKNTLIRVMSTNAKRDTDINYGAISSETNGQGIYELTKIETNGPIYYYRGAVENNNVIFGGFCWKMIRSTETGGVKVIYNGVPNEGVCDATGEATEIGKSAFNDQENDPKYVGYMYDNNTKDSTIKGVIDTWFEENLLIYQEYLEDTPFYNERDYVEGVGFPMAFAPRVRVWGTRIGNYAETVPKTTIKLGAANAEDIFTVSSELGNGALTYPVGLITSDEVIMAGGRGWISESDTGGNTNYYLHTGSWYWTISPSLFGPETRTEGWRIAKDGSVSDIPVTSCGGVRPVISLKLETKYIGGTGTKESPFIITE